MYFSFNNFIKPIDILNSKELCFIIFGKNLEKFKLWHTAASSPSHGEK